MQTHLTNHNTCEHVFDGQIFTENTLYLVTSKLLMEIS